MKKVNLGVYCSVAAIASIIPSVANSAIRVGNLSRNNAQAYQQINSTNQSVNPAAAAVGPRGPIATGTNGAQSSTVTEEEEPVSEACASLYPDGEFENASPNVGYTVGGEKTCTARVGLYAFGAGLNGSNLLLAEGNLAAGDSMLCNISSFPEAAMVASAVESVEFPGDKEPTVDDVINAMNQEQKQHAGMKILSMAVVGALGGNVTGANEAGKDGLLGTSKDKLINTAIGAAAGAALGAGSAYSGKVAGDMIMSTGVNAAAGATVGNIMSQGSEVLRITDCLVPDENATSEQQEGDKDKEVPQNEGYKTEKCLWGKLVKAKQLCLNNSKCPNGSTNYKWAFYNITTEDTVVCETKDDTTQTYKNCKSLELLDIKLEAYKNKTLEEAEKLGFLDIKNNNDKAFYYNASTKEISKVAGDNTEKWAEIFSTSGEPDGSPKPAYIVGVKDAPFGYKRDKYGDFKTESGITKDNFLDKLYLRASDGKASALTESDKQAGYTLDNFRPEYIGGDDGQLIDFGNKARMQSTLIGAGAGAAAGAYSAYQGAQSDIQERWVAEVRAYKDSLQKFYCQTGGRFLSQYNDLVRIPALPEEETEE